MKSKILIVDDEKDICDLVELNLVSNGFENVKSVFDGKTAIETAAAWLPDLILLDVMLPEIDGLGVCRILKENETTKDIPIILLTAKSREYDIVNGFETGADDYVTKPFSNKVLIARIKAHLRNKNSGEILSYKNLTVNLSSCTAALDGRKLNLTFSEFEILAALTRHPSKVHTRSELIEMLRGNEGFEITERAIDVHIVNLRRKLGEFGSAIETVRGIGYKFGDEK